MQPLRAPVLGATTLGTWEFSRAAERKSVREVRHYHHTRPVRLPILSLDSKSTRLPRQKPIPRSTQSAATRRLRHFFFADRGMTIGHGLPGFLGFFVMGMTGMTVGYLVGQDGDDPPQTPPHPPPPPPYSVRLKAGRHYGKGSVSPLALLTRA